MTEINLQVETSGTLYEKGHSNAPGRAGWYWHQSIQTGHCGGEFRDRAKELFEEMQAAAGHAGISISFPLNYSISKPVKQ